MKVGFVGLGKMGSGMANNLLRAGHELTVFNRSREKAKTLEREGAQVADSPAHAARTSDALFSMLADDHAASQVVFGENGIAAGLRKDAIHVSSSTISVAFAKQLAAEHAKRGQIYFGAPVFGRPDAAEAAKLIVIAAGDKHVAETLQPLFSAIGRQTFFVGSEPWAANAVKLCGNFMIASMMETFSEAFASLRKAGLDHHLFLQIMTELWQSPVYKNYGAAIADRKFEPAGFGLKLGLKDVRQLLEFADGISAPMPLASLLRDQFLSAMANGQENMDWSSIERVSARSAGLL